MATRSKNAVQCLLISLLALVALAGTAHARLFFVPGDPALQSAAVVPLDASIGLAPGTSQVAHMLPGGTQMTLSTTHPQGMFGPVFLGMDAFVAFFPDGVVVDFSPPVSAVGVQHTVAECFAVVDFDGSAGDEHFMAQFGGSNLFIGAADLGDISQIVLNDGCFAAGFSEIHVSEGSVAPPTSTADLSLRKLPGRGLASQADVSIDWNLTVQNLGPDASDGARTIDFLPRGTNVVASSPPHAILAGTRIAQQGIGVLAPGGVFPLTLSTDIPPFYPDPAVDTIFSCESVIRNVALATATSIDPVSGNNVAVADVAFDKSSRSGFGEICDNRQDDDCDGRIDCSEASCRSHPHCSPPVVWGPPQPLDCFALPCPFPPGFGIPVPAPDPPTPPRPCTSSDVHGRPIEVPSHCCALNGPRVNGRAPQECTPIRDPNFKTADPPVNALGYGYTEAGRIHSYEITYENTGEADAHDVSVIDVLDEDLDDSTLVVQDGGVYDPTTRAIHWLDPLPVPPLTPRSVSFSVAVRGDAEPFTHVRNQATAIFPNAVPSERLDTNVVEHLVVEPGLIEFDPGVVACRETSPGSGEWDVVLFNKGNGEAWNATAEILNPPASLAVGHGEVAFGQPDDFAGSTDRLSIPLNATPSLGTVAFETETPGDPCRTLWWRIRWQPAPGEPFEERDVQVDPDADLDAVTDAIDVCPDDYDPAQVDSDGDGIGDACAPPPPSGNDPVADLLAFRKLQVATLLWSPAPGAVDYDVLRSDDGGPFATIATGYRTPKAAFQDVTIQDGVEYAYRVVWYDGAGAASPPSNVAVAFEIQHGGLCGLVGIEVLLVLAVRRRLDLGRRGRALRGAARGLRAAGQPVAP